MGEVAPRARQNRLHDTVLCQVRHRGAGSRASPPFGSSQLSEQVPFFGLMSIFT